MKPSELQIGNWVYYKDKEQMPCIVRSILGNSIRFDNGTPQDWMSDVGNFTPIPLTAEILEKNGFKHSIPHNDWTNADCNFYLYEGGNGYRIQNTDIKLDYVHQLQQALRLCGIEKDMII